MELRRAKSQALPDIEKRDIIDGVKAEEEIIQVKESELTKDMKYIKWPAKVKVASEVVTVFFTTLFMCMLSSAGSRIGLAIITTLLEKF